MDGAQPDLNSTAASLLGFLETYGPMSGYDIVGMVEGSIGYFWNVTRSQVYRELTRLAEGELVEVGESGARARRPYTITGAGRRAFLNWLALPPGPDIIRLPFLLRYFFGQNLDPNTLRAFVDLHRSQHEQRLSYFRNMAVKLADEQPFMAHVAELGVAYEQTMLTWFDSIPVDLAAARPKIRPARDPARDPGRDPALDPGRQAIEHLPL